MRVFDSRGAGGGGVVVAMTVEETILAGRRWPGVGYADIHDIGGPATYCLAKEPQLHRRPVVSFVGIVLRREVGVERTIRPRLDIVFANRRKPCASTEEGVSISLAS